MANAPRGSDLLGVARRMLLDELLPPLPPEKTYAARMVARAMAIAARELDQHDAVEQESAGRIAVFLESSGAAPGAEPTAQTLAGLIPQRKTAPGARPARHPARQHAGP